jgi:uncharacterized Ntn-hydrolase superfamily protein
MQEEREKIEAAYKERAEIKKAMIEAGQTAGGDLRTKYDAAVVRLNDALAASGFDHTTTHDLLKLLASRYGVE